MTNSLNFNHVGSTHTDSTRELLLSEFFGKEEEWFQSISTSKTSYNDPVKIEIIENLISTLKSKGATHISIDYNSDHEEYEIDGYQIQKTSDEDYELLKKDELEKEINHLQLQRQQLDVMISNLKTKI